MVLLAEGGVLKFREGSNRYLPPTGAATHNPSQDVRPRKRLEPVAMSKRELIERIMQLNRSARREFLQCFTENELADYLRQLESVYADHKLQTAVTSNN
jgi:hypothetical protein